MELAEALDVSRGPVREALLRLEREGLVRIGWHRGATVTQLSAQDVDEIDSLRATLEQLAVEQVIATASDAHLDVIAEAAERMQHARDELDVRRCLRGRRAPATGGGVAGDPSQVHLFRLSRVQISAEGYMAHIPSEHRELVAALRARDRDVAVDRFAAHRRHAAEILAIDTRPTQEIGTSSRRRSRVRRSGT